MNFEKNSLSIEFTTRDILTWTGGNKIQGSGKTTFNATSIDTRSLREGALFVAIRGDKYDAHNFLSEAMDRKAAGLLISQRGKLPESFRKCSIIAVRDTTKALGDIARGHRQSFSGTLVAITGSNGKTTTKEMCASILGVDSSCLKTSGNLNNQFGVPLTLHSRRSDHECAVIEIGMNHRGEIAPLAKIAKPNIGIITNIGTAHIEHLGSQEEISKEKGDLVANLGPDSTAVLNADDPFVMSQSERCLGRTITFGHENAAEVMARDVESLGDYGFSYNLVTDRGSQNVKIKGLGESTVINSLAASAGAIAAGVTLEQIQEGLHRYEPPQGRMEKILLDNNICLIHDAYNANPQSVRNALTSLTRLKTSNRGIAVLGDMGELGSASPEAHRKSGELAAELGVSLLFLIGDWAEKVRAGALANGMSSQQIMISKDLEKLGESIREALRENDWVLIKGSRSMQMERLVEYLVRSS